jgi:hypothetical protein
MLAHPYAAFEDSAIWRIVDKAIRELEENQDIELATARQYVIGLICERLYEELFAARGDGMSDS